VQVMALFDKDERKLKHKTREVALLRSNNTLAQERVQELVAQVHEYGACVWEYFIKSRGGGNIFLMP